MENFLIPSTVTITRLLIEIILFLILTLAAAFIVKRLPKVKSRYFDLNEYLPEEQIHTLTQVFYLAVMTACFVNVMYTLIYLNADSIYFVLLDITISLYIAATIDKSTAVHKLLILLLVPYGSLYYLLFNSTLVGVVDLIHAPVFLYFMKYYYDKFREYTESKGLKITVILLFSVIFVSFIVTSIVEKTNPLDSIALVSNAFTSNGYAVLGNSEIGKINSLILAWMGFIMASVGTATLTAAILKRQFKNQLKGYDEKLEDLDNKLDEVNSNLENLKELIKKNN